MPKAPKEAVTEAPAEAVQEAPAEATEPIKFAEPISTADQTAVVADNPAEQAISEAQMAALQAEAARDDTKRDFTLKVLEARAKKDEAPPPTPEVAPRIAEQTRLEMEAGQKMNAHHAALAVRRSTPAPTPADGHSKAVFRPGDYVPDQKKGQGHVQGRNL